MDQYVPCQCLVVKLENELGNRFLLLLVVCNIQAQTRWTVDQVPFDLHLQSEIITEGRSCDTTVALN